MLRICRLTQAIDASTWNRPMSTMELKPTSTVTILGSARGLDDRAPMRFIGGSYQRLRARFCYIGSGCMGSLQFSFMVIHPYSKIKPQRSDESETPR